MMQSDREVRREYWIKKTFSSPRKYWDYGENEPLKHDPDECVECNYRWWEGLGWEPARGRLGEYHGG